MGQIRSYEILVFWKTVTSTLLNKKYSLYNDSIYYNYLYCDGTGVPAVIKSPSVLSKDIIYW